MRSWTLSRFVAFVVLPLLAGAVAFQAALDATPERQLEMATNRLEDVPPVSAAIEMTAMLMMGGLKALAVDYLWVRRSDLVQDRQWLEAVQLSELITKLQPRNEEVWSFIVWDLVYNIPATIEERPEKWKYVSRGIRLGEEGALRNPQSPFIYFNMGFMLYHRLQQDPYLIELYRIERHRSPFEESREWFEKSRRALAEWIRREGPDAVYYAPSRILISDDILGNYIRNVSIQDAGLTLFIGGDPATARASLERALVEVRRDLIQDSSDRLQQRYRDTIGDLLTAVRLEAESRDLLRGGGGEAYRAKRLATWRAYRQAILNPEDPNEPANIRRMDILRDTFFVEPWTRVGRELGADDWEPNDMAPFRSRFRFADNRAQFQANLAPLSTDIDRYSFDVSAGGTVRFELRWLPGRLTPRVRLAELGSETGAEAPLAPVSSSTDDGAGRALVETPLLLPGVEYLIEVRNEEGKTWSTSPYEVRAEFRPSAGK